MIKATYIDHMGDDLRVANAARVSFDKESSWEYSGDDLCIGCPTPCPGCGGLALRDAKLIGYLAKHGHWTPFSHPQITLREDVPIFVARQRFKHMVGFTYNEVSRRYVNDEPKFYQPELWRRKADNVKQGSSDAVVVKYHSTNFFGEGWTEPGEEHARLYALALSIYQEMIENGVCAEQARMVLPQSMMTSYYTTGSLAAFARAYKQRIDPHSQKEIRDLAQQWDQIIRPLFPVSWAALVDG